MTDLNKLFGLDTIDENRGAAVRPRFVNALRHMLKSGYEQAHLVLEKAMIETIIKDMSFAIQEHPMGVPDGLVPDDPIDLSGVKIHQPPHPKE